VQLNAKR